MAAAGEVDQAEEEHGKGSGLEIGCLGATNDMCYDETMRRQKRLAEVERRRHP